MGDQRHSPEATQQRADEVLEGRSGRGFLSRLLPFLGPAFIASIAYMDPGNFATNIQGGAQFGYLLLWVVVASNLMAMLVQSLSAKLGIATGLNLPEMIRAGVPAPADLGALGPGRDRGDGHRSRRVPGRGGRLLSALRHPAASGRAADRRGHLRHPRPAALRVPAAGGGHHRLRRA